MRSHRRVGSASLSVGALMGLTLAAGSVRGAAVQERRQDDARKVCNERDAWNAAVDERKAEKQRRKGRA